MTDARAHNARSPSPMVPGAWHEEYDGNASLRRRSSTLPVPVVQSTKAASSSTDTPLHLDHVVDFQHRLSQSLQSNSAAQKLQSFVPSVFRPFSAHPKEDLEARGSRPSSPSQLDGLSPASRLNKVIGTHRNSDTSTAAYSPPISPNRHTYKRLDDTPPASPARSPRLSMRGSPASRVRTATSISTLNSSPFFSGHGNFSGESPTTTSRPSLSIGHPSASSFSSSPMTSTNSPLTLSPMMFSSPASRRDFDGTDQPSAPKLYGVSSRGSTDSLHVGSHRHDFEPLSSNRLNVTPGEERLSPLRPIRRSPGTPSPSPRRPRPSADSFLRNDYFNFGPAQGPQSAQLSSLNIENASVFSNRMLTTLSLPGSPDISTSMDLTPLSIDSHLLITASTSEAATPDEQIPWTLSMEGLSEASPALSLPESLALSPSPSLRARLGLDRDEAGHLVVFPSPSTTSPNLASRTFDTQADTLRPLALEDSMDGVGDTTRAFLDSSVAQFAATYLNSTFDHSEEDALPLDGILSHGRARQNTPHSPVVSSVQTGAVSPSTTAARQQYLRQVSTTPELVNPGVLSRMRQLGSRMRTLLLKDKGASHKLDVLMTQTIRRRSYHSPARREAEYLAPRRPPSPPSRARSAHILRSRPIAPPRPSEPTSANGSSIGHSTPLVTSLPPTPPDTQALRGRNIPTSPPDGAPASMVPPSKTRRRFSLSVFGLSSPLHARTPPSPSAIQHRQARTTSSPLRIAPNRRPHSMALIFPPGGESPRQHAPESRERHNGSLRNASAREMDQFMPDVPIEDIVRIMDENEEGYEDRERLLGPPGLEDFNVNRTRRRQAHSRGRAFSMSASYISALQRKKREGEALASQLESDHITKKLQELLEDVSSVVRVADGDPQVATEMPAIVDAAYDTLESILQLTVDGEISSIESYTENVNTPLVRDPDTMENMIQSLMSPAFMDLLMFLGGGQLPKKKLPKVENFHKTPKPHANTNALARFRHGAAPELPESATTAQAVLYGCCSIFHDEGIPAPTDAVTAPNSDILLMAGVTGWKQRDPHLRYYLMDDISSTNLMPERTTIKSGLLGFVEEMAIDPTRKLIYAADDQRIKSFAYDGSKYKPTHTLKTTRGGPLAVVDNGARLFRAGKGGIDVWDVDALPTHGEDGKQHIGEGSINTEDTWRDEFGVAKVETSTGTPCTTSIDFADTQMTVERWHLPSWWSTGGQLKALSHLKDTYSSVLAMDLRDNGKIAARYLGHTGEITDISSSEGDPNAFITAGDEGVVRLFDVRHPLPQISFKCAEMEKTYSALYVHVDGIPVVFTGGTRSQSIKVWDPRAQKLVYELATGNNEVESLVWDASRSTLYAATECSYMDRMGNTNEYRRAKIPAGPEVQDRRELGKGRLTQKRKPWDKNRERKERSGRYNDGEEGDENENEDDDDDDEEEDDEEEEEEEEEEEQFTTDPEKAWPERAYHAENYFGYTFDCGNHRLLRYKFGLDADPKEVPAYG
ncbi:hypothetical protein HDZ31DRAFT_22604, partial [Schizophyllum fasciatum]